MSRLVKRGETPRMPSSLKLVEFHPGYLNNLSASPRTNFWEPLSTFKLRRTDIVLQTNVQEFTFHTITSCGVKTLDIALLQRFRWTGSPGGVGDLIGNLIASQCVNVTAEVTVCVDIDFSIRQ